MSIDNVSLDKYIIIKSILNKIDLYDKIIVHRHVNPDLDALGSQLGLKLILEGMGKTVFVVGEESEGLKFLGRMDTIEDDVYEDSLVIVCDTANTERISDSRFDKGNYLIKIDHHPNREPYGDICFVDTDYSSTSEMIADLFDGYSYSKEASKLLYAGIIGDTGRFLYDNTKVNTFKTASVLLEKGFNPNDIYSELYKERIEVSRLKGYILQNFQVTESGLAYMYLSDGILEKFNVSRNEASNLVNVLSGIVGNEIWLFLIKTEEGYRIRIRSKNTAINIVAEEFGGGGHPLASGVNLKEREETVILLNRLNSLLM